MAEAPEGQGSLGSQMFRETAMRKMASADDLDRYLQVTNPSAWVLIGAIAVLLVAGLIWGLTASLPLTVTTTGVLRNGEVVCFLPIDESAMATEQSKVTAAGFDTSITSINTNPHSQREVMETLGSDYALASSDTGHWNYKLIVALPEEISDWVEGDDVPIEITTREMAPIAYLFGGAQA